MIRDNEGFNPLKINELKEKMKRKNKSFIIIDSEDNNEEYVNFFFVGKFEGKEVIYDAVIYTLRLHHSSEIFEIAEQKASKKFPGYGNINFEELNFGDASTLSEKEEEIGLFLTETIMELEDEEAVKVQEHIDIDPQIEFGVSLDAGLNVESITEDIIEKFIKDFNEGSLKLDKTLYSFQTQDNEGPYN